MPRIGTAWKSSSARLSPSILTPSYAGETHWQSWGFAIASRLLDDSAPGGLRSVWVIVALGLAPGGWLRSCPLFESNVWKPKRHRIELHSDFSKEIGVPSQREVAEHAKLDANFQTWQLLPSTIPSHTNQSRQPGQIFSHSTECYCHDRSTTTTMYRDPRPECTQ